MVLADYAEPEGHTCWPSQSVLARVCMMTDRSIVNCLNRLATGGYLTRLKKGNQYQASLYRLNVPASPRIYEGETRASETVSSSSESETRRIVKVKPETSEGEIPVGTNRHEPSLEPPLLLIMPRWVEILAQDSRWKTPKNGYIEDIQAAFSTIDLTIEAHKAYDWLQAPKGLKKKALASFWLNWLKTASVQPAFLGGDNDNGSRPEHRGNTPASAFAKYSTG